MRGRVLIAVVLGVPLAVVTAAAILFAMAYAAPAHAPSSVIRVALPSTRGEVGLPKIQGPADASRPLVVIDAGHGGHDPGASGQRGEKEKALIAYLRDEMPFDGARYSVILFGELFGSGVQDMAYGMKDGEKRFRLFDIAINGNYLDYDVKRSLCEKFGIEMVPVLYRGPYSKGVVEEHTSGPTTMCSAGNISGKFKGREGLVATPTVEQYSAGVCGRMIVKSISADYLERKGGTDSH